MWVSYSHVAGCAFYYTHNMTHNNKVKSRAVGGVAEFMLAAEAERFRQFLEEHDD